MKRLDHGQSFRRAAASVLVAVAGGAVVLSVSCASPHKAPPAKEAGKELKPLGKPRPIKARNWDQPFTPIKTLWGSYCSFIRVRPDRYEVFNNSVGGGLQDGITRFVGKSLLEYGPSEIVAKHELINDVLGPDGRLSDIRRFTRPFVAYDPRDGYFMIAHVCDGYGPRDGRVYPSFLTSKTGDPGTWTYHGRLKGEVYDQFGPEKGKSAQWADGGGLFYQPQCPATLDRENPLQNRFLFFTNRYVDGNGLVLLISADAKEWAFYRKDGKIVNLFPPEIAAIPNCFTYVIRAGRHGWHCWFSEKWPPVAIWHVRSADGLHWEFFRGNRPEIVKPKDRFIKNLNAWYDPETDLLHGFLSVWEQLEDKTENYRKYHSTMKDF